MIYGVYGKVGLSACCHLGVIIAYRVYIHAAVWALGGTSCISQNNRTSLFLSATVHAMSCQGVNAVKTALVAPRAVQCGIIQVRKTHAKWSV